MNIAYLRVSTDDQELKNQKFEILNYCDHHKMKVDSWINVEVSSRKSKKDRKLKELDNLKAGDILIVSELSRLGRSVLEVVGMVEDLLRREIEFISIKQNLRLTAHDASSKIIVTIFSLVAELERDFISSRTKTALARKKAEGMKLGRPRGSQSKSKLDGHEAEIKKILEKKVSKASIAKILDCSWGTLDHYVKTRQLLVEEG